jgi:uncharacterized protein (TIGR02118 family)
MTQESYPLQKVIVLARRKEGLALSELRAHQCDHAKLVRKITAVQHYRMNFPQSIGEEPAYDVMVELWVESVQAFQEALASAAAQEALEHSPTYLRPEMVFLYVEELEGW